MKPITYPAPLRRGARIGVTAPSSGVPPILHARLDHVIAGLKARGFDVVEGRCLRDQKREVSAPAGDRAADFTALWTRDDVHAIIPPWGGELLIEILSRLDFDALARHPKWLLGYSDTSTLLLPLTLRTGIATAHGLNLMDLAPEQRDPLSRAVFDMLSLAPGDALEQDSSEKHQLHWTDFARDPRVSFNLTEPTRWRLLSGGEPVTIRGRLIGGCLDTVVNLVGTPFGDVPAFNRTYREDGVILYLENCELRPTGVARALWQMRLAGWMEGVTGILLGRSDGPDARDPGLLTYVEALESALGDLGIPVLYDIDCGHRPPQMTLVNGAMATVTVSRGRGRVVQAFS